MLPPMARSAPQPHFFDRETRLLRDPDQLIPSEDSIVVDAGE